MNQELEILTFLNEIKFESNDTIFKNLKAIVKSCDTKFFWIYARFLKGLCPHLKLNSHTSGFSQNMSSQITFYVNSKSERVGLNKCLIGHLFVNKDKLHGTGYLGFKINGKPIYDLKLREL
jgi:hypothetical protein